MDDPISKILGIVGIVGVPLAIVTWVVTKFIPSLFVELKAQRDAFLVANKEQQTNFLDSIKQLSAASAVERNEFEKQVVEREKTRETAIESRLKSILDSGERREEKVSEAMKSIVNALNQLSELLTAKVIRDEIEHLSSQEKQRAGARAILSERNKEAGK